MLSRVADSGYWMSRYIERAENVARYVDVSLQSSLDGPISPGKQWMPLVAAAGDQALFLEKYDQAMAAKDRGEAVLRFLAFDQDYPNSIIPCVSKARENARQVRGCLALEAWEHLNKFYHLLISSDARRRAAESPHGTSSSWGASWSAPIRLRAFSTSNTSSSCPIRPMWVRWWTICSGRRSCIR